MMRAACCVAVLFFSWPASAQVFNPESFTLKNGMQVVVLPNHRAPVITHMLWLKTGSVEDPKGKSGIAHFQEHLMFKGTKTRKDGEYSKIISRMGGEENAFTSYDFTAYYATFGKENLEQVMALEADRLGNWRISQKQVDSEKLVILKERQQNVDNEPSPRFWEEMNAELFRGHAYARPVIGWKNEIENLSKADIEHFHEKYYAPNNIIAVISGDVTAAEIKPLAEKYYASLKPFPSVDPMMGELEKVEIERRLERTSPQVKETVWSMHFLTLPARSETIAQSDALSVLAKIMGDSRIGHLYRRLVRQEKLATNASISFDPVSRGWTRFSIVVTPSPTADLAKIEAIVREEIAKITAKPLPDSDIKNAVQAMDIETVYARDSVMGPAMIVGEALTSGLDLETIESWPIRIRAVNAAAVQDAANRLFDTQKPLIAVLKPETITTENK